MERGGRVGSKSETGIPGPQREGQGGSGGQHRGSERLCSSAELAMSSRTALGTGQCHPEARLGARS